MRGTRIYPASRKSCDVRHMTLPQYTRARSHEPSTHARDSFPKTSLDTKRAIYSRTLNTYIFYKDILILSLITKLLIPIIV